jgi:zinc transport system permease protein
MQVIQDALSLEFIRLALIAGPMIAMSCALLGGFLVLRRYSMIGDGLAHVSFATVALGILLGTQPLVISIPLVMIASLGILKLSQNGSMDGDAAIGLLSAFSVALAVMISSVADGFDIDLFSYLFGSILTMTYQDVWMSGGLLFVVALIVTLLYNDLFALTYDEEFARSNGVKTERYNRLLVLLTAVTVVLGVRIVGTMLISSLIVIPTVTALQLRTGFKSLLLWSLFFSLTSMIGGILLSYAYDLPTGATVVLVNFGYFLVTYFLRLVRR